MIKESVQRKPASRGPLEAHLAVHLCATQWLRVGCPWRGWPLEGRWCYVCRVLKDGRYQPYVIFQGHFHRPIYDAPWDKTVRSHVCGGYELYPTRFNLHRDFIWLSRNTPCINFYFVWVISMLLTYFFLLYHALL